MDLTRCGLSLFSGWDDQSLQRSSVGRLTEVARPSGHMHSVGITF